MSGPPSDDDAPTGERAVESAARADGGTATGPGNRLDRRTEATEATEAAEPAEPLEDEADGDGEAADGSVRVCWLEDEDADDVIGALSSETARTLLSAVHEQSRTASELADSADTSVQNVRHHITKLMDAGLVEAVDTRYSVKGREMTVYGPADERVVVAVGGDERERDSLVDSLGGLLGALAVLAVGSVLVQALFGAGVVSLSGPASAPRVGDAVGTTGAAVLGVLSPGAAFLLGGLAALATVLAVARLRGR